MTEAILQYISMRTDYAVMLRGAWGSGKTYYVNNVLIPEIEKKKEHKAIMISLFGISSVDEINTKIFMETLPILSDGKVQMGGQIAKIALRGAANFFRLGDLEKYSGDIGQIMSKLTDQKRLIVFFDDFERKGNISLSELTGYINMLVEDKSSKVVLIANEEEIAEVKEATDEKNTYQPFKEKLVRSTLYFDPDFDTSLQEILDAKYSDGCSVYRPFLDNHTEEIKRRFVQEAQNKNLRTLSFALETFRYVFCSIHNWNDEAQKKYEKDQLEKYSREMFLFSLAVCIEYREGRLQDVGLEKISHEKNFAEILEEQRGPEADKELGDTLSFQGKYYKGERCYPFPSLFNFIVGKAPFKTEVAISEIDELIDRDTVKPEWQAYYKARSRDHFRMSNADFEKFYKSLRSYATKGLYPLNDMLNVASYLVWMAKALGRDLTELEQDLKGGIEALLRRAEGVDEIDLRYSRKDYDEVVWALIQYSNKVNETIKREKHSDETKSLNNLMEENFDRFVEELQSSKFDNRPVLAYLDITTFNVSFHQIVKEGSNESIYKFLLFVNNRYRNIMKEYTESEKKFFKSFGQLLLDYTLSEQTLTAELIRETEETVKTILEKGTTKRN